MRVIGGKYRSRRLGSAKGMDIRPTSDRLRETLFDVLTAGNPGALEGTIWLDLYAGTGAVGIEALSRGAATVYFVDTDSVAIEVVKRNLASLGISGGVRIIKRDAVRALEDLTSEGVAPDFIFLDPPYRMEDVYQKTLQALAKSHLLKSESLVIAEHQKRFDPGEEFSSLRRSRKLVQGDAALSFYRPA